MEQVTKFLYHNYFIFIPLAVIMLFWDIKETLRIARLHPCYRLFSLIPLLALLYPLTKIAQFGMIGPTWFRSYCADIGFIPCFTYIAILQEFSADLNFRKIRLKTWAAAIFAMGAEFFQIFLLKGGYLNLSLFNKLTARGDVADMWIFFSMLIILLVIINISEKRTREAWQSIYDGLPGIEKRKYREKKAQILSNLKVKL